MLGQCVAFISTDSGLVFSLLMAGLVGGFTHCTGMCSPFVLAQVTDREKNISEKLVNESLFFKIIKATLMPYHFGRITTYVVMAVIVNYFINAAFVFSPLKNGLSAALLILAGLVFIISAIPEAGRYVSWVMRIRIPIPSGWVEKLAAPFMLRTKLWHSYVLGILLGFLPCGLVVAALMALSTADSVMMAAFGMAAFGVGTMPALIMVGFGGWLFGDLWPKIVHPLSKGIMVMNGLILFFMAGKLII